MASKIITGIIWALTIMLAFYLNQALAVIPSNKFDTIITWGFSLFFIYLLMSVFIRPLLVIFAEWCGAEVN